MRLFSHQAPVFEELISDAKIAASEAIHDRIDGKLVELLAHVEGISDLDKLSKVSLKIGELVDEVIGGSRV